MRHWVKFYNNESETYTVAFRDENDPMDTYWVELSIPPFINEEYASLLVYSLNNTERHKYESHS